MARKTLQQVADDEVIHKLAPIVEFIDSNSGHGLDFTDVDSFTEMGSKEVWGVRDARTRFSKLLSQVSTGDIQFVSAGDGSMIVMISAKTLGEAMSSFEERRGLTLGAAIAQLPYGQADLKHVKLKRHAPARGLLRRARVAEEA